MDNQVRIDKWLWAVRIFKTRSLASEACKKGKVLIDNIPAKSSRVIKIGDIIQVKKSPITYSYKVLQLTGKRMGAKLVPDFMVDVTPKKELEVLEMQKNMNWLQRERGTGRPTKKDRRDLNEFFESE